MSPDVPAGTGPTRVRDAARTRRSLLEAGLRHFAEEGYAGTTLRQVADDAGVNVALIKRYFGSKEGLFEACLQAAGEGLREEARASSPEEAASLMARHALGLGATASPSTSTGARALLLLLRSSDDEVINALRHRVLRQHSDRLAQVLSGGAGSPAGEEPAPADLLRAQVALATAVGVAVLSASPGLEPLRSADPDDLAELFRELLRAAPERT